jgi:hypothetical protein
MECLLSCGSLPALGHVTWLSTREVVLERAISSRDYLYFLLTNEGMENKGERKVTGYLTQFNTHTPSIASIPLPKRRGYHNPYSEDPQNPPPSLLSKNA